MVPPVETAFHVHMSAWRLDGPPRTARRYTTDQNGPWPTPEARLLWIVVSLQTAALPVVQGRRFGMGQRTAPPGIQGLLVVRQGTRRALGEAPTRSVTERATRLGVTAADVSALVGSAHAPPSASEPPAAAPAQPPASPRLRLMGPHDVAGGPRIRLRRRAVIAARTRATRSKLCG